MIIVIDDDDDDDDDDDLPERRYIGFYTTRVLDEGGDVPLPSLQTIIDEQLVQGRCAVAWGRFDFVNLWLQGTEHTTTPPHLDLVIIGIIIITSKSGGWARHVFHIDVLDEDRIAK